jgi:hypothetical protein
MENDELQEKLDQVLDQKTKYIFPENIKKDITILGVTGIIDSSPLSNEEYDQAMTIINNILGIEEE